jgi:hypothetical protein
VAPWQFGGTTGEHCNKDGSVGVEDQPDMILGNSFEYTKYYFKRGYPFLIAMVALAIFLFVFLQVALFLPGSRLK